MEIIIYILLIGLFAGFVKGASGFGSSLVAIPLLSLLFFSTEPRTMMITANVLLNVLLIVENKTYFNKENMVKLLPLTLSGVAFTWLGLYVSDSINATTLRYIVGGLLFVAIFTKMFTINLHIKDSLLNRIIFGAFSGVGNGIASVDGPPVLLYLTSINAKKKAFKGTLALHFLIMGVMAVIMLFIQGAYTQGLVINTLYLVLALLIGLGLGMWYSKHLNEERFEKIVLIILIALGISMFL